MRSSGVKAVSLPDFDRMQGRAVGQPSTRTKRELHYAKATAASLGKVLQDTPNGALAIDAFDGLPGYGPPLQGATLKDLCEEDKQKVARLIRQVSIQSK